MGLRIQRRFKLLPGVHVNLSKSGLSLSLGPTGLKTTIGSKGVRTNVGIPGTGIRYETPWHNSSGQPSAMGVFQGQAEPSPPNNQTTGKSMRVMRSSSQPISDEYKQKRTALMIFRIGYIIAGLIGSVFIIANVEAGPDRVFFLFVFMAVIVCLILCDVCLLYAINQGENEQLQQQRNSIAQAKEAERQRQNRFRQAQRNMMLENRQDSAVDEWTRRCEKAGGLIVIKSSFPCKRGEGVLYTENGVTLAETRKVRVAGGTSIEQWTTLDTGTLHVTNQRLVLSETVAPVP